MVFYNHSLEVRPLHSRVVGPAMAPSWQVFFLIPPLPPPPPPPPSKCDGAWVDATLRVVKVMNCNQQRFGTPPAS